VRPGLNERRTWGLHAAQGIGLRGGLTSPWVGSYHRIKNQSHCASGLLLVHFPFAFRWLPADGDADSQGVGMV
jgi:hypothetical protein